MIIKFILLAFVLKPIFGSACVEQYELSKQDIGNYLFEGSYKVEIENKFVSLLSPIKLKDGKNYTIQRTIKYLESEADHDAYDKKYKKYYRYSHMNKFIQSYSAAFEQLNYQVKVAGKSVNGRNLYSIRPHKIDPDKKIIIMFGRHHGDEGSANWIIEGFVEKLWQSNFFEDYQLFLYPMINPDGAENHSRYNANNRDLNRVWGKDAKTSFDEVKVVYKDLEPVLSKYNSQIKIVLDMHGSFTEDFIYRVKKDFKTPDFYELQNDFIHGLGSFDFHQAGNFKLSNGETTMARIRMINKFGLNALTHETIRNIPKSSERGIIELKKQGKAILETILSLY